MTTRSYHTTPLALRADARLPAGVIGQVEGVALVYGVIDCHGTTFAGSSSQKNGVA